jgi:hypothetical protein
MKKLLILLVSMFLMNCQNTNTVKDIEDIKLALHTSAIKWSNGNMEGYMNVYWNSDRLQFIGEKGITYGWKKTLENYKKGYPTKDLTGTLTFKVLSVDYLAKDLYSLIGEYHLERKSGNTNGIFNLIFKKIDNKWVIITDHTQ